MDKGLTFGWILAPGQSPQPLSDSVDITKHESVSGAGCWLHFSGDDVDRDALIHKWSVPEIMVEALLAEDPRPRSVAVGAGQLIILRGVNLNEGAEPEDMISLRVWLTENLLITVTRRPSRAVEDGRKCLEENGAVNGVDGCLAMLLRNLTNRISEVVDDICDEADQLEEMILQQESYQLRPRIADIRRQSIALRRYLAPQRDALFQLYAEIPGWFDALEKSRLREGGDRMMRFVEDLDSLRDRVAVTQEELTSRLSEQMNRTMYILALITGLFLPLGFVTGLLGINVGGMPGIDNHYAFSVVCVVLLLLAVGQYFLFRRLRWIAREKDR